LARFPARTRLVLTHQGASLRLLEHPEAFMRLARRADAVTSVSAAGVRELRHIRGDAKVVYNGARPLESRGGSEEPFILSVGRVAAYKGLDILAMAFSGIEAPSVKWVACGPDQTGGEFRRLLARLGLAGRVRLAGSLAPAAVRRLLERCLAFAHPSRMENCPMALLEAMAAGKAVVATRVGGVPELIRGGREGLLVQAGDAEGLARALRRLLRSDGLRRRLGEAARKRAGRFTWERAAADYLGLYATQVTL
jgi:glycosyltransferase involved in cell wall biosynthesis